MALTEEEEEEDEEGKIENNRSNRRKFLIKIKQKLNTKLLKDVTEKGSIKDRIPIELFKN